MTMPTRKEYLAAKARYATWSEDQHKDLTPDMLTDVDTINAYERAANESD